MRPTPQPSRSARPATALITGASGQDGGYLAEQLVAQGLEVHGVVRADDEPSQHPQSLNVHSIELTDEPRLAGLLAEVAPDVVYNLVGLSSVAQSWAEPVLTSEVNGVFVARLLELVWRQQESSGAPVRFVQASSGEIFAGSPTSPQDEETAIRPRSPYGASKAYAHGLVQVFRARGLHASNAILYNHESPRRPESFVTRKITATVAAIARGRVRELVLGNLDASRDWGWAPEYVDAMVRMAEHHEGDDFVIATGESHTVADFVAAAFAHVGIEDWQPYVRSDPALVRPVDALRLVGDPSKAGRVLGWKPEVGFAELVGRMVDADLQR